MCQSVRCSLCVLFNVWALVSGGATGRCTTEDVTGSDDEVQQPSLVQVQRLASRPARGSQRPAYFDDASSLVAATKKSERETKKPNPSLISEDDGTRKSEAERARETNISILYEALDMMSLIAGHNLGIGTSVNLDEQGYKEVAETKDPQQMEFFVRRIASQMGLRVREQGGLQGIIPFYDGENSVQTFEALHAELERVSDENGWVTSEASGVSAPLTDVGYKHVASMLNTKEMSEFVRRVALDLGLAIQDEGGLLGVAEWHSGEKAVQSFKDLRAELVDASKRSNSWVALGKPCNATSHPNPDQLDEIQQQSEKWAPSSEQAEDRMMPDNEPEEKKADNEPDSDIPDGEHEMHQTEADEKHDAVENDERLDADKEKEQEQHEDKEKKAPSTPL